MEAKKHPVLVATLAAFGIASLAGVVLTGMEYSAYSKNADKLAAADRQANGLLSNESVALTKENLDVANAALAALKTAEAGYRSELGGSSAKAFAREFNGDAGELGSKIKKSVDDWRTAFRDASVRIVVPKPEDYAFGFSRYYQTGSNPPQKSLNDIYRQTQIVDFILRSLIESKVRDDLRLVSMEREPVELGAVRPGSNASRDEVSGINDSIFRRDGLVRSEFYRVRFVAKTGVLRRFVNTITDSGRALAVRGVEAAVPSAELLANPQSATTEPGAVVALPANLFGDQPAADAAKPETPAVEAKSEVVVHDGPSDFTVVLAYVEPVVKTEASEPAPAEPLNK